MSDLMLLAVLRMPPELWDNDPFFDGTQRHDRYLQAADRIEADGVVIARMKAALERIAKYPAARNEELGIESAREIARDALGLTD